MDPHLDPATGKPLGITLRHDGPPNVEPLATAVLYPDDRAAKAAVSERGKADRLLVGIEFDGAPYFDLRAARGLSMERLGRNDPRAWAIVAAAGEAGAAVLSIRADDTEKDPDRMGRVEVVFVRAFPGMAKVTSEALWSSHDDKSGKGGGPRLRLPSALRPHWSLPRILMFLLWQACVTLGMADQLVSVLSSRVSVPLVVLLAPAVALSLVIGWFGGIKLLDFRDWALYRCRSWHEERRRRKARAFMRTLVAAAEELQQSEDGGPAWRGRMRDAKPR